MIVHTCEKGELSGPMTKGMTYIVRPRILPSNSECMIDTICSGSFQLFCCMQFEEHTCIETQSPRTSIPHQWQVSHHRRVSTLGSADVFRSALMHTQRCLIPCSQHPPCSRCRCRSALPHEPLHERHRNIATECSARRPARLTPT